MNLSNEILSNLTIFSKYAKYDSTKERRETWEEITSRVKAMYLDRFPELTENINKAFEIVLNKEAVPSMRSMQFAGRPIELNNSRIFNCAFTAVQTWKDFAEIMLLLLGGTGVGFSVQNCHISKLPSITQPSKTRKFLVGDSIEGWADAVRALFKAYMAGGTLPLFDYSDIRQKGMPLITAGGKAPGPEPLERCLNKIKSGLDKKQNGERLTTIEVHDIVCHIADAVLSGGIRRAALISFFDNTDNDMLTCKGNFKVEVLNGGFHLNPRSKMYEGEVKYKNKAQYLALSQKQFEDFQTDKTLPWYYFEPQRARANNSVVFVRNEVVKDDFDRIWDLVKKSGAGEPGIAFTNDRNNLFNPCAEIALESRQFCNLSEINFPNEVNNELLMERAWAATFIGTLQASFTDFHYLSSKWQDNSERDSLLGVSITGIADNKNYRDFDWKAVTDMITKTNEETAKAIGINPAARITCIKPSGTTSTVLGTASGVHARFAEFYKRRLRFNKNEAIATYLQIYHPELVEDEFGNPNSIVVSIPISSPKTSILRSESAIDTLERVKFLHANWIKPTHKKGVNSHNVSCTINIKPNEWDKVGKWMWENRDHYNAISVLPYDGGTYIQAPFEEITEEQYNEMFKHLSKVDLTKVIEDMDYTDLKGELACSGSSCEIV